MSEKTMRVIVWNGKARTAHADISAVGIGHLRKDLVLVPEGEHTRPIEVKPDDWTRLNISRGKIGRA